MRFFPDFDREGPDGDLPRKTGLPRFWEVLSRDFWNIFHAGALGLRTAAGAGLIAGILLVLALMDLPFLRLVKNALLLFLGQLPRSVGALAILAGYLGLMTRFFTLAVTILPFTNLWVPMFPALFLIYPGINENFRIEEQLRGK